MQHAKWLVSLMILALTACAPVQTAPTQEAAPRLVIGMVQHLSESTWRDQVSQSILSAAQENNIQTITVECERTQNAQIQAMRALITYQVDAILLSPLVLRGWDNVLQDAQEAGIPVIMVQRNIQTDTQNTVAAYVGADYEAQGKAAAMHIMRTFSGRSQPVAIMELHGTVGSSDTVERSRGIRSLFGQSERFNIYSTASCNYMQTKAREMMKAHLDAGKIPDVLISYSDSMTLGAIEAMEYAGIAPGKQVHILSFDAQQDAIALLQEGKINCIIETDPYVGSLVVQTVLSLEEGPLSNPQVYLESDVFDANSDLSTLMPRGY